MAFDKSWRIHSPKAYNLTSDSCIGQDIFLFKQTFIPRVKKKLSMKKNSKQREIQPKTKKSKAMHVDAESSRDKDDEIREKIDIESKKLIDELIVMNKTMKAGSIEREKREDEIYRKLYEFAELIQKHNWTQKNMRHLFYLITNQKLKSDEKSDWNFDDLYTDRHKMFTRFPDDTKTHLFLEKLHESTKTLTPEQIKQILNDPNIDGKKELLEAMTENCARTKLLHEASHKTCSSCWRDVMRSIFFMLSEMLTVELKTRSHQILKMSENKEITTQDAVELSELLREVIKKLEHYITKSDKVISKKEWIELIESVFLLMIQMINEIMMRYVLTKKINESAMTQGLF